jgi:hypothetical protein
MPSAGEQRERTREKGWEKAPFSTPREKATARLLSYVADEKAR